MPLTNGETFAGYTIVRLLGSGGMGEVYLAQHPRLPRRDALKLLPQDWSADAEYRGRFNREADLASTLWHPHIVGVHDRGEEDGQLWIAMDFVDGLDAARFLSTRYPGGMPVDEVVRIVTAVASALDHAHKQGLLHRDVKPANIMIAHPDDDSEQRILLTDFGIARNINDISGLTATNMAVGTVAYSAPEQLLGEAVDGRADQYALAATAYHLLTGSFLHSHSNPIVVSNRHINNPPPALADTRPELAKLDPVLATALAKQPGERYRRCSDFARALSEQTWSTSPTTSLAPTVSTAKATSSAKKAQNQASKTATKPKTASPAPKSTAPAKKPTNPTSKPESPANTAGSRSIATQQEHESIQPLMYWLPWIAIVAVFAAIGGVVAIWRPWEQSFTPSSTKSPDGLTSVSQILASSTTTSVRPPPPPPTLSPKAIDQVLLTADQLGAVLGTSVTNNLAAAGGGGAVLSLNSSSYGMADHSGQVTPRSCVGVVFTGEHDAYATANPQEIKTQTYGNLYGSGPGVQHLLQQTVAVFAFSEQAQQFLESSRAQWETCSRSEVDATFGFEHGAGYDFGRVQRQGDLITVVMATNSGENGPDACQQALGVHDNVVVEVRACTMPSTNALPTIRDPSWATHDAERVVQAMLQNVRP